MNITRGAPVCTSLWQHRGQCTTLHLEFILKLSHENESKVKTAVEFRNESGGGYLPLPVATLVPFTFDSTDTATDQRIESHLPAQVLTCQLLDSIKLLLPILLRHFYNHVYPDKDIIMAKCTEHSIITSTQPFSYSSMTAGRTYRQTAANKMGIWNAPTESCSIEMAQSVEMLTIQHAAHRLSFSVS